MLRVNTRKLENVTVLALEGRIVTGETATLCDAIEQQSDAVSLVLDLARVTTVDARGLGLMLELRDQVQSKGIRFKVINANQLVRRVFEITRLDSVFEFSPAVEFTPAVSRTRARDLMPYAACA
jgi:anti-anti-sigma factor